MNSINQIWAVGRNYALHAKELNESIPKEPIIFLKSANCLVINQNKIALPIWAQQVDHEVELAILLGDNLQPSHFGLALDLTERKKQSEAKANGLPWTLCKSFIGACPITELLKIEKTTDLSQFSFSLRVNGELRQEGKVTDMIFSIPQLIEFLKSHFPVQPGDLILTGTPAGIAPLKNGDICEVELGSLIRKKWEVAQKA